MSIIYAAAKELRDMPLLDLPNTARRFHLQGGRVVGAKTENGKQLLLLEPAPEVTWMINHEIPFSVWVNADHVRLFSR